MFFFKFLKGHRRGTASKTPWWLLTHTIQMHRC